MDRPLGSTHPRFPQMVYPVNYGYVEGIFARDGAEQDIYLLGINEPVEEYFGRVVAVYHRLNDNEDKWIVVPDGYEITEKEILDQISFQERFFEGELYM
ncbi:MAG: inorganic pyrophosphatase [Butyrivibrio sp.]|nr:inorganic pyrophosphatase [Butyrivibrio sp.]